MPKYRVHLTTGAWASAEVEADDPEAAVDAAFDGDLPYICAQCSGWGQDWSLELGEEWEPVADAPVELVEES